MSVLFTCFVLLKGSGGAAEKNGTLLCWIAPLDIQGTLLVTGETMSSLGAVEPVQVDVSRAQDFRDKAV